MDYIVHASVCEKKDKRRRYAEFLLNLALKKGAKLSEPELKEIKEASESKSKQKRKAVKEISSLKSVKAKYKRFLKTIRVGKKTHLTQ